MCSMGEMAASGGYMIASACDKIVAQPTTITGSIGVIFLKLSIQRCVKSTCLRSFTVNHNNTEIIYITCLD